MTIRYRIVRTLAAIMAVFLFAGAAQFAGAKSATAQELGSGEEVRILVLPFQINAGPEMDRLNDELPQLVMQRIMAQGIPVVPEQQVIDLLRRERITTFNLQVVRSLAKRLGASAAIYGSYSQVGDSFSIDSRYVEADSERVRPFYVERGAVIELLPAVEELATRVGNEAKRREVVSEIIVRGTRVLEPDVVLMRLNTRKGDVVNMDALDREVRRIWDLGYFNDVSVSVEPRPDGLALIYTVVEKPRILSIRVEGASDLDEEDIIAVMQTRTGAVLNERILADDLQRIIELYRKDGYYLAEVSQSQESREDGTAAALVVSVREGNKLYVRNIVIEGAEILDAGDVKDELMVSERNILSWLTGSGVLQEELLDRDTAAIASYYMNHGFMDVEVAQPRVDYEENGITVTFFLKEGPRYKLGEVRFRGDLLDTDETLRNQIVMDDMAARGDYFTLTSMQDDTRALTNYYAEYGYAFADIVPIPEKRPGFEEPTVDINFDIEKKQKVYIRRAVIEGNTRTRDNVILRELRLTDGDMFVGSRLQRSTERLNRLGYFDIAEAELVPTANEEEVDLKITVKEKSTGQIMAGFGYSTYSAFGVSGTIMERNLFGKGYVASFNALFSGRRTAYTLSFTNPRVYDTDLSFGTDLYNWRDDYYDYEKDTTGGVLRFGYPIGEYTGIGASYRLDTYRISDVDDDASHFIRDIAHEDRFSSVVSLSIGRDTTDSDMPTRGSINSLRGDYGGGIIGGDDDFMKLTAEHQTYYTLREGHTLHLRVKGAMLFKNGNEDVPVFERFWMGGMDSVRGYRAKDLVPRDEVYDDRLGGTRMAFANFEYIWALHSGVGLYAVPFFDIGFNLDHNQDYSWNDEVKKSVGLELRWRSPMGDLRFAYGIPLDEDRHGDRDGGRFEFSMGQFF